MATTSLWRVHGWLGKLVIYVENPEKTENPKFYRKPDNDQNQSQQLTDVINYAVNTNKTTLQTHDEAEPVTEQFVSGINVSTLTARDSMMTTKRAFEKTGGVVAYHGYQSFAPGEATPEIAHEIGKKLAAQLWGEKYQVLVATHLDKSNHLHNHFIINTVSFIDGKKFHRTKKDYYDMQKASDALCREYGLSVIENPERGKSKHYAEWNAERQGKPTQRSMVQMDVDTAIRRSMTERQFYDSLRKLGYEIKTGKDISVRYIGKERFVRLKRSFGEEYSIENIRRRILAQTKPETIAQRTPQNNYKFRGKFVPHRKAGLRVLYVHYLYRVGYLPQKREPNPKQVYYRFRDDIRYIRRISEEARLLAKHSIDTDVELKAHKQSVQTQMESLNDRRKHLRSRLRSAKDEGLKESMKSDISGLSKEMGVLRRELNLCSEIEWRSLDMDEKLSLAQNDKKPKVKELMKDERIRRCR